MQSLAKSQKPKKMPKKMFDLSLGELGLVALAALIIIKPEDLPGAAQKIGQFFSKAKAQAKALFDAAEIAEINADIKDIEADFKGQLYEITNLEGEQQIAFNISELEGLPQKNPTTKP